MMNKCQYWGKKSWSVQACSVPSLLSAGSKATQAKQQASSTIMSSLLLWHVFKNSINLGGYTGLNISIWCAAVSKNSASKQSRQLYYHYSQHVCQLFPGLLLPEWIQPVAGKRNMSLILLIIIMSAAHAQVPCRGLFTLL